ncbi:SCP-2 sterol transfer family protein [Loktanella sp. DSM 29012]|uniref:SCP2 sterol-binding domain-containing protein n=1 Tax=Loktanella gaetbuli TaxID=2881335 RepID=A0ABS8BS16_9RHOB|nr:MULTISPECIES: SCP2 sterol-binding domain-containing protein [Loktanella]KQI68923.1 sterol carrier family protein [Loktanella sp. 3ANDIMAR09]MCB5198530.1 SCP2 sterol-binding domain-containing protein [Loktanella gaetbuli]SEQ57862.1 SCP-2 sterol transfer family protein [Loktanella sp. DSM 29012]
MSDIVSAAVTQLNAKMDGESFDGTAKFVIEGEGALMIAGTDVTACADDAEADVTLTASRDTFEGIMTGDENPTAAFMTGKLTIDGDMGKAMALAGVIS